MMVNMMSSPCSDRWRGELNGQGVLDLLNKGGCGNRYIVESG